MKRILRIAFVVLCAVITSATGSYVFAAERIETVANDAKAIPVRGGVELSASEQTRFEIYSITGQQVKSVTINGESQTIELPKGCYIVRSPQWSKKVIVK